jgi:hypothetical protein
MSRVLTLGTILTLTACASPGPAILAPPLLPEGSAGTVELTDTPFYSENDRSSGPAALATMLMASGVSATPAQLIPLVHSQRQSLQSELKQLPPRYERLAYPLAPDLSSILVELESHHPVLVRQSSGRSLLSEGHFAVVIGYDSHADTLLLRSGTTPRQVISARDFMLAWSNADRWAMLVLRPGELPAAASRDSYLEAAMEFEHDARPQDSLLAFDAALQRWPDEPVAWMGRAVSLQQAGERVAAAHDFETSLRIDGSNALARNGLAMTLLDLGCVQEAQDQIDKIREYVLPDPLRRTIEGSRDRISARFQTPTLQEPPVCTQLAR